MKQYSISFIFDFKEHHSQNAHSGKKPTVMSTYSFTAEKKLEFSHLFLESSPALKIPDYAPARQSRFLRDISEVISVIQIHFADV